MHINEVSTYIYIYICMYMDGCQNYGPFLGPHYNTAPNILGYPKRDHNFDNHPYIYIYTDMYIYIYTRNIYM